MDLDGGPRGRQRAAKLRSTIDFYQSTKNVRTGPQVVFVVHGRKFRYRVLQEHLQRF